MNYCNCPNCRTDNCPNALDAEAQSGAAVPSSDLLGAVVDFIKSKITAAERTLKCREEMQKVWRGGTDASWQKVGCFKSKADRLKDSATHGRIAEKNRRELQMFKAVLQYLQAANDKLRHGAKNPNV